MKNLKNQLYVPVSANIARGKVSGVYLLERFWRCKVTSTFRFLLIFLVIFLNFFLPKLCVPFFSHLTPPKTGLISAQKKGAFYTQCVESTFFLMRQIRAMN